MLQRDTRPLRVKNILRGGCDPELPSDYLTAASLAHQCVSFSELTKPQLDHRTGSIQPSALTRPDTAVRPH